MDAADFLHYLNGFQVLSEVAKELLRSAIQPCALEKGAFLAEEGKVCSKLFFLKKGYVRGFHNQDGKEITYWFGFENSLATSIPSFISRKPARESIVLMEPGEMLFIHHEDLQKVYRQSHELEHIGRLISEYHYVLLEERMFSYLFKTAKERYDHLIETSPHILRRVPLGYVASYLGITQETLSRIRGKN